jgi:transposase
VAEAANCGFQLLPYPPYSPDLAPSDFVLFPKLKSELRGHHFRTDDEVIHAVEEQRSRFTRMCTFFGSKTHISRTKLFFFTREKTL